MRLKHKYFGFIKLPTGPVGQGRHRVGITMFLGAFVAEMLAVIMLIYVYFHNAPGELPHGTIFGLDFEAQALLFVIVEAASALGIVASLFVLGAGFVERLQEAFRWPGDAQAPA